MKKLFASVIMCALFIFSFSTAQAQYEQGQLDVNLGVGLLPTFYGSGTTQAIPPVGLSVDYGVSDKISIGGYAAYASTKIDGFDDWGYNYTIIGVRGAYHFDVGSEKFDTYAGGLLGYNIVSFSGDDSFTGAAASAAAFSVFLGGRYRFTDNLGAFAELGYGISVLQLGLNLKF
ncbi:outer membrane beta-barrel protein [Bernardetia sp. Wsw4-3y2]|uniref:outer membrane beta-barrel protein n=1 Tax=Bernardetia sp. Wsw4-3y2 TaxID=3127471 RepID=UPI0030CBE709